MIRIKIKALKIFGIQACCFAIMFFFARCKPELLSVSPNDNTDNTSIVHVFNTYSEMLQNKYLRQNGEVVFIKSSNNIFHFDGLTWLPLKNFVNKERLLERYIGNIEIDTPAYRKQLGMFDGKWFIGDILSNSWSLLDKYLPKNNQLSLGDSLMNESLTISLPNTEKMAHDSKIISMNDKLIIGYYSNETELYEGGARQKIKVVVVNKNNFLERRYYDIFIPGERVGSFNIDWAPCYTPELVKIDNDNVRIIARISIKGVQTIVYRDLNILNGDLQSPQISKFCTRNEKELIPLNLKEVISNLNLASISELNTEGLSMWMVGEPKYLGKKLIMMLTVGRFKSNPSDCIGTSIWAESLDNGVSFILSNVFDKEELKDANFQLVEGCWGKALNSDSLTIFCRNDQNGILQFMCDSTRRIIRKTTLNEKYGLLTQNSKPLIYSGGTNKILTLLNVETYLNRTKKIEFGRNTIHLYSGNSYNIENSELKLILSNTNGCHYPSICFSDGYYYMTFTSDSRNLTSSKTGEIKLIKFNIL